MALYARWQQCAGNCGGKPKISLHSVTRKLRKAQVTQVCGGMMNDEPIFILHRTLLQHMLRDMTNMVPEIFYECRNLVCFGNPASSNAFPMFSCSF